MAELKRCPECGGVATVIHMYDTYDRADFGWDAGCGRYRDGDDQDADFEGNGRQS